MQVIRWKETGAPQEQDLRGHMQSQGLSPYAWSNGPGERYTVHCHSYQDRSRGGRLHDSARKGAAQCRGWPSRCNLPGGGSTVARTV